MTIYRCLGDFPKDKILALITDGAPVMKATANVLKKDYSMRKLAHFKCLAHGLHNVCDDIRAYFGNAENLVMKVKGFFTNASKRKKILKAACPSLKAIPSPICTRWGTFLRAVQYYNDAQNRNELTIGSFRKSIIFLFFSRKPLLVYVFDYLQISNVELLSLVITCYLLIP